jgi:hypothetical protein
MRRLFIIAMVVLLPLRAWAGDLMGVQMSTIGLAPHVSSAMEPGCVMHVVAGAPKADAEALPGAGEACASCDLCIPMTEPERVEFESGGNAAHAKPVTGSAAFVSALPARTLEPPIP